MTMTPRERVLTSFDHRTPDRTPRDFWAEAPTWKRHKVRDVPVSPNPHYQEDFADLPLDVNGDGALDFMVSADLHDASADDAGRVYVIAGDILPSLPGEPPALSALIWPTLLTKPLSWRLETTNRLWP